MLIRLRLTLLYSAILALTLGLFGAALYTVQADATLKAIQQEIAKNGDALSRSLMIGMFDPTSDIFKLLRVRPPGDPNETFPGGQVFPDMREREMLRVLDGNGKVLASPLGAALNPLPLNAEGLAAVQSGKIVWQTASLNDQELLIYNRPIRVNSEVVFILQIGRPLNERNQALAALAQTLLLGSLLTVLLAFGIGWFFARAALRPIQRITQTAQAIGAESDLSRRVDYRGPNDEVGQLAGTFNGMLARLQEAYQRVSRALRLQRNFVADVSHELRTPLTTVRGNLALLRHDLPPAEREDILNDIEEESDRLIRLVNSLLVLARADAAEAVETQDFAPLHTPLRPLIAEAARQARALDSAREIVEDCPEGLVVSAGRDELKQILLILLDNALKHARGPITLSAADEGAEVLIRVQDSGPGIPAEALPHIFERFYRGAGQSAPGFGLGLPIAKALVERLGGTIQIASSPAGATVELRLGRAADSSQQSDVSGQP